MDSKETKCEHNYMPYEWKVNWWKNNWTITRYDGKTVGSVYCTKCLKIEDLN